MMRRILPLLLIVLPHAVAAQQQTLPQLLPVDPAVTIGTLSNGMQYYIRENRRPEKRAELRLVVNAGSVLEDEDQLGLAHFVEHMAFNGTANFEQQELVHFLERSGVRFGPHLNAYTSFDETVYMLQVPTDSAEVLTTAFQILEDWAHGVAFDTTEIRKERGVVIEEWRGRRGAGARLADQTYPVLFRGSPYAERLPIGTRESLETFEPDVLRRFYRDWYRPDLMAVVAVGDFDAADIERLIRVHFERVPARSNGRVRPEHALPRRADAAAVIATDAEATQTQVQLLFFQPARERGSVEAFRGSLVTGLYSQMLNARLGEIARTSDAPFLAAQAGTGRLVRATELFALAAAVADTGVERGLEAVLLEVERVQRHGFTPAELERAKRNLLRSYERSYEERENSESASFAGQYVQNFLTDQPIPGIVTQLELVRELLPAISLDDVNAAADDWLGVEDQVVVVQAPEKPELALPEGDALLALMDRVRESDITAYEETVSDAPLVAAPLRTAEIVEAAQDAELGITSWTLENGVRVILKPTDFKVDEVLFTAWSPGGTSLVPDSLLTSARVATQAAMAGGAGEFSAVDLEKRLAGVVAQAGAAIGTYHEALSGGASPADLETLFELIHLRFTAPRADTAAFQALLAGFRAQLANRSASPVAAFQDTLAAVLAQYHPRTRPFTVERVDSIDLGQAMTVYRDRFADAGDFTFVFVGGFDVETMRPLVQRYLGTLPSLERGEVPVDVGVSAPDGVVERVVRKGIEPRSQTTIVFSGPMEYTPDERFSLSTLTDVLEIRLREQLREERGGTYGVQVAADPFREPWPQYRLSISFGSAPERVDELLADVFAEVDALRRGGAREDDLAKVREQRLRDRETALRQNGFWLNLLSNADRNGEDVQDVLDLRSRLDRLTSESVREAAHQFLDPERYVRVTLVPEDAQAADATSSETPSSDPPSSDPSSSDPPSPGAEAESRQASPLQLFLECDACDARGARPDVAYIEYVQRAEDADLHVKVVHDESGADDVAYELSFVGRGRFEGRNDTLRYAPDAEESDPKRDAALRQMIELGLVRYAAATELARSIRISYEPDSPQARGPAAAPGSTASAAQQTGAQESSARPRTPRQQRRWAAGVDLGFTGSSGNSELIALTSGFRVRHLRTNAFRLDWMASYRYGESRGEVAARHMQSKLDFDLGPAARVAPFVSLTAERDPFRRLAMRSRGGTGVRYGFYRGERGEASLRAAMLYGHERFTPEADRAARSEGAWSFKLNANQRLGEAVRIESATSFDPVVDDFGDYNLDLTSKVSTRITRNLALTVSHTYAYDSTPVEGVRPADQRFQTGLTIDF